MTTTVEAIIDKTGTVRILGPISISSARRALVVILEESAPVGSETAQLSEAARAQARARPEPDEAKRQLRILRRARAPTSGPDDTLGLDCAGCPSSHIEEVGGELIVWTLISCDELHCNYEAQGIV